jgi:uncharacterized RDD family membrane protein YckC
MDFTYKIVGGDGREYGPVSLDDLVVWIHDGRVAVETPVQRSDLSSAKPADDYLELRFELNQAAKKALLVESDEIPVVDGTVVVENAGFFPRFCAYVLDWFMLYTMGMLLNSALGWKPPEALTPQFFGSAMFLKMMVLDLAVSFAYTVFFIASSGATPGKFMMGLRVVAVSGEKIGFGRALLRWIGEFVSGLTLGIGYLMVIWHPERRALHDLIAGTKVVMQR